MKPIVHTKALDEALCSAHSAEGRSSWIIEYGRQGSSNGIRSLTGDEQRLRLSDDIRNAADSGSHNWHPRAHSLEEGDRRTFGPRSLDPSIEGRKIGCSPWHQSMPVKSIRKAEPLGLLLEGAPLTALPNY